MQSRFFCVSFILYERDVFVTFNEGSFKRIGNVLSILNYRQVRRVELFYFSLSKYRTIVSAHQSEDLKDVFCDQDSSNIPHNRNRWERG